MANHEMLEIWPLTWRDTKFIANGVIRELENKELQKALSSEDLRALVTTIDHVQSVWRKPNLTPIIRDGVGLIRSHFVRKFQIETNLPTDEQYRLILEKTLPTGHFEASASDDPELKAMAVLVCYEMVEARRNSSAD